MLGTSVALKRIILGRSRGSRQAPHHLLPKRVALPVFGSVPLSSIAYATQEMALVLALAGAAALALVLPLSVAVVALLAVVFTCYRQIVRTYPHGGAYIAAKDNLGEYPALVAAAALIVQYPLTMAVSVAAAVAAAASAVPEIGDHRVLLALVAVAAVTGASLRAGREAGTLAALTTYAFLAVLLVLVATGVVRCALGACPQAASAGADLAAVEALSPWLALQAFAVGAVVLTGVETTANSVAGFRYPQSMHAAMTLARIGVVAAVLFLGIGYLVFATGVTPHEGLARTAVAEVALALFGDGLGFLLVQATTAAVLLLAAHTSCSDFPRLASVLARDRWLPRQFLARGDRLVFSNALLLLGLAAGVLLVAGGGSVTALVPLYILAVFTTFTLSQAGMARRWMQQRESGWKGSLALQAAGALVCAVVLGVVAATSFTAGGWAVIAAVGLLVALLRVIHRHYREVGARLRSAVAEQPRANHAVILLDRVDEPAARALSYALSIQPASIRALGVPLPGADLAPRWAVLAPDVPLQILQGAREPGTAEALVRALTAEAERNGPDAFTTAVIPETLSRSWVQQVREHRLALRVKALLHREGRVVVADVTSPFGGPGPYTLEEPAEHHVVVLVSAVDAATVRALAYAAGLHASSVRALGVSLDPERSTNLLVDWDDWGLETPVEVVDSPFRSLTATVRGFVQGFAPDGRHTVVTCVLPTFVVEHPLQSALHNQSAMLLRSMLLFERGVVATSVPYPLGGPQARTAGAGALEAGGRDAP